MGVYHDSTAIPDEEDFGEITGVRDVADVRAAGRASENVALGIEERCGERGHPPSALHDGCCCGLVRYD